MCLSLATLRFGAFALGQHASITSFKLTVLYTKKIEIFGSYARGERKETSDLDVIVEFEKRKSLLELVGIEQELEDKYKTKIGEGES
ncbi:MAG: nucleotidyltransferase domain-containing protein [Candidatus Methanospirare jalkutatii]|nr:nucleotidyltransferase domain-containing protein [Candidatus Methanospirare jalkutatii]